MERTAEEIATIFKNAGDSVTVINNLAALSSLDTEDIERLKRNIQHLEIVKAYKTEEDPEVSIWTTEDFSEQDAAVALGKSKLQE